MTLAKTETVKTGYLQIFFNLFYLMLFGSYRNKANALCYMWWLVRAHSGTW